MTNFCLMQLKEDYGNKNIWRLEYLDRRNISDNKSSMRNISDNQCTITDERETLSGNEHSNIEIKQNNAKTRAQTKIGLLFKAFNVKFKNEKCKIDNTLFDNTSDLYRFLFKSSPFSLTNKYARRVKRLCDKLSKKKMKMLSKSTLKYMDSIV